MFIGDITLCCTSKSDISKKNSCIMNRLNACYEVLHEKINVSWLSSNDTLDRHNRLAWNVVGSRGGRS